MNALTIGAGERGSILDWLFAVKVPVFNVGNDTVMGADCEADEDSESACICMDAVGACCGVWLGAAAAITKFAF